MINLIDKSKNIFFLGIKGVAMANLAVILKKMGKQVYGVDLKEEFITDKLLKENQINYQFNFSDLPGNIDLFVYSAAHQGINNPLSKKAQKKGIKIISQTQLIGELMKKFDVKIAVSGCHGKTTTSSLLAYSLIKLNQKSSYLVGTPYFNDYPGGDFQEKKYFIVEADEYGVNPPIDITPKFFYLQPDWIIATNIDFDHPDVYQNIEETKKAFLKFFENKKLILNIDDENLSDVYKKLNNQKNIFTYGFSDQADFQIINWQINKNGSSLAIKNLGEFRINLFGKHNVSNATAVILQLVKLGFNIDEIKKSLLGFFGAKRRMELIYQEDFYLVDDYAHHPREIEATLRAVKQRFENRRVIVIFQPHTFSRTLSLLSDFRKSLELADIGLILPIFASARENKDQFKISAKDIVGKSKKLIYCQDKIDLINQLKQIIKKNDVIITMGAGDVYQLKDEIVNLKI